MLGNARRGFVVNAAARGQAPLLVEIDDRQLPASVVVHANGARGYAPSARYERLSFTDVTLRFTPVTVPGGAMEYRAAGKIGEGGLYTPWQLGTQAPIGAGSYALDLEIGRIDNVLGTSGPVTIRLDDRFEIASAAAAARPGPR